MTRKHFETIARILSKQIDLAGSNNKDENPTLRAMGAGAKVAIENIANELADAMRAENPRFDRARFLKACGL